MFQATAVKLILIAITIVPTLAIVIPTRTKFDPNPPTTGIYTASNNAPARETAPTQWRESARVLLESIFFGATPKTRTIESKTKVSRWCGTKYYSDLIRDGTHYLERTDDIVMVFESPSASASCGTSFCNEKKFKFLDHPLPRAPVLARTVLGPLRYAAMSGNSFPTYLQTAPPSKLIEHWCRAIPNFSIPTFLHHIPPTTTICAFLPLEGLGDQHLIDPDVHYELAGKRAIPMMTSHTTKILPSTQPDFRPCVVKVSQSMGSRGIFVIRNDADEAELEKFLRDAGNPDSIVTSCVDICRNLACHFFIHPWGDITWFGSSENLPNGFGGWSGDSTMHINEQDYLCELLTPYCLDVAKYCSARGYWGACGIDVLLDHQGQGYVVDVNPRVTGTCPALMIFHKLREDGGRPWTCGKFRRSSRHSFPGSVDALLAEVDAYNASDSECEVVVLSLCEKNSKSTRLNIAVYGDCDDDCDRILNRFAPLSRHGSF